MRIRWTPEALDDLKHISVYVEEQRNLATANRVCRTLYDAIQTLRRHPESGRVGERAGTRELVVPPLPYAVVYRLVGTEGVQILRIWHGARQRQ